MKKEMRPSVLDLLKDIDSIDNNQDAFDEMMNAAATIIGNFARDLSAGGRSKLWEAVAQGILRSSNMEVTVENCKNKRKKRYADAENEG